MIKVYADLIMKGEKSIDQVPLKIRDAVIAELVKRGWVTE